MVTQLKHLFSAGRIGAVDIRNRIVMSPMGIDTKPNLIDRHLSPRFVDYYEARAQGGVGLIIVSWGITEEKSAPFTETYVGIWDDSFIPALSKLVEALHKHGAKVGFHLLHGGSYVRSARSGMQPVSASAFRNWLTGETCREVTREEIKGIVENFGKAVKRAKEAGFDLVEYNAFSGSLLREFLSPITNKRTDEYGGNLGNRLRILKEIICSSREQVGSQYTLIAKISGDEYLPGGNRLNEAVEMVKLLEGWGLDGVHVSPAGHLSIVPLNPGLTPKGAFLYLTQAVKEQVEFPVIATHVGGDVFIAEKALADGKADFVAFGRSLLADPDLPRKAMEGRFEDIRPCIRCVQGCFDTVFVEKETTCFMNPAMGREKEFDIKPASHKKKVMVIGGGPAGMEAALIAAFRGHEVTLYEKSNRLGGQLKIAAVPPGKEDFAQAVSYYSTQLTKRGVAIKLNTEATVELVEREKPGTVIVATGAQPIIPHIPGVDGKNVCTSFEVLEGMVDIGRRVAIIGGGGIGCDTALYLATLGAMDPETAIFLMRWKALDPEAALEMTMKSREVTILEMLPAIAGDVGMARKGILKRALTLSGVKTVTGAKATAITAEGVQFIDEESKTQTITVDTVVLAVGTRSVNAVYQALQGKVPELHIIGDAKVPRKAMDAIHEAARLAKEI